MSQPYPANRHGLSRAMISAMRQAIAPSRAYVVEDDDATAIAYARWLAGRHCLPLPGHDSRDARAIVERGYPAGITTWGPRHYRAKAVRFETGGEYTESLYNSRGKFKGYGPRRWVCEQVLARIEIPNWDHIPTVIERDSAATNGGSHGPPQ